MISLRSSFFAKPIPLLSHLILSVSLTAAALEPAIAGVYDRAHLIFRRIAHVPPTPAELNTMVGHLNNFSLPSAERDARAAEVAILNRNFYDTSLIAFFATSTNVEESVDPLNDAIATNIGIIRDDVPYKEVLYGDHYYRGVAGMNLAPPSATPTLYDWKPDNNEHYLRMQELRVDLSKKGADALLVRVPQSQSVFESAIPGVVNNQVLKDGVLTQSFNVVLQSTSNGSPSTYAADIAGVISTRAMAESYFTAGTNRRMFRFILRNYLCNDLEDIKDNTVTTQYIRRDVDRFPGGNHQTFQMSCQGCHGIQDAFTSAFAFFNFRNDRMNYKRAPNPTASPSVQTKMTQNAGIFPDGHVVSSDAWTNAIFSSNDPAKIAKLGWRTPDGGSELAGNGAHSLGKALAHTRAFSACQVRKVFKHVCLREPLAAEAARLEEITDQFEDPNGSNYNFKSLFKAVVNVCL